LLLEKYFSVSGNERWQGRDRRVETVEGNYPVIVVNTCNFCNDYKWYRKYM